MKATTATRRAMAPALLLLAAATGCVNVARLGPGGAWPGLVYNDVVYPNANEPANVREIPYADGGVEILEWVETEHESTGVALRTSVGQLNPDNVIGVKAADYAALLRELREDHKLDGLLNQTVDTYGWVLDVYIVAVARWHTRLGGVGYRLKDVKQPQP